jgi:hypothetical protein
MAFSKLKAHLRATAARTIEDLWKAIGNIGLLFSPEECANYFCSIGYGLACECDALDQRPSACCPTDERRLKM